MGFFKKVILWLIGEKEQENTVCIESRLVKDYCSELPTWDEINKMVDETEKKILNVFQEKGKDNVNISIYEVGYVEPTHVVDVNGSWVLGYTMYEILKVDFDGEEIGLGDYLNNDLCGRFTWKYVLDDIDSLINEGFFDDIGERIN